MRSTAPWFTACFLIIFAPLILCLWGCAQTRPAENSDATTVGPVELPEVMVRLVKHDRDGVALLVKQRGVSDSIQFGYPDALLPDLGATEGVLLAIGSARVLPHASEQNTMSKLLDEELEIRKSLQSAPQDGALHQVLGFIYLKEGKNDGAASESARAVKLQPEWASAHFQLGLAFLERKNLNEATPQLREAMRLRPDLFIFHRVLARAALDAGEMKLAEYEFYQDAARSRDPFPHEMLADIYIKRGDFKSALRQYNNILLNHPNDVNAKRKLEEALKLSEQPYPVTATSNSQPVAHSFDPALLQPSSLRVRAPDTFYVQLMTTRGGLLMTVNRSWAPNAADRFYNLVIHHFYDNTLLYRVIPQFVVQFGISPYPRVSEAWQNANFKDDRVTHSNQRGYVAFAKSGPNTSTTQIFISLKDNSSLNAMGYAPMALVDTDGLKVAETLYDKYGEISPSAQAQFMQQGNAFAEKTWPHLDRIISATIIDIAP